MALGCSGRDAWTGASLVGALGLQQRRCGGIDLLRFQVNGDMRGCSLEVVRHHVHGISFSVNCYLYVDLLDDLLNSELPDVDSELLYLTVLIFSTRSSFITICFN
jgi:hypothetical protein